MPSRRYYNRVARAIRCLVRWADVVERDDARSLLGALESKQVSTARSDNRRTRGAHVACKRPVDQGYGRVVVGRLPVVACRRIRLQLDSEVLSL